MNLLINLNNALACSLLKVPFVQFKRLAYVIMAFFIVLSIGFPCLSFANNPYYELAAEVLERMIAKAAYQSETKILLGSWAAEREA